jgi:3-phytase
MRLTFPAFALLALVAACEEEEEDGPGPIPAGIAHVRAAVETTPVASKDDAADDPAIWVHPGDPAQSLILGTDKDAGLYVYTLDGAVRQFLEAGEVNNVDLRQNVTIGNWTGDVAAASNRTDNTLTLFTLTNGEAAVSGKAASPIDEPYGSCMGLAGDETLAFITYKTGDVVMYRLSGPGKAAEAGRLKLSSQLEACVFDDEAGVLYIGEEDVGIWKSAYEGGVLGEPVAVDRVGGDTGLVADIEGLALYKTGADRGYLIASSQGDNSHAVYERDGDNRFITRFAIAPGATIDGAEETDGVEAVSANLGPSFPNGVFIAQDGFNAPKGSPQNFKIVDWRDIQAVIDATAAAPAEE